MDLLFTGGTAQARQLVSSTLTLSSYDWSRIPTIVSVSWLDDPYPGIHDEYGVTLIPGHQGGIDRIGRPMSADLVLRNGLEDPAKAQPGGVTGGEALVHDVVHHELGHVLAALFVNGYTRDGVAHQPHRKIICEAFGGTLTDWHPDGSAWEDRIEEAFAETFKDVYLPRAQRLADNRTNWKLPASGYTAFLDVIDDLCPSPFGGGTS